MISGLSTYCAMISWFSLLHVDRTLVLSLTERSYNNFKDAMWNYVYKSPESSSCSRRIVVPTRDFTGFHAFRGIADFTRSHAFRGISDFMRFHAFRWTPATVKHLLVLLRTDLWTLANCHPLWGLKYHLFKRPRKFVDCYLKIATSKCVFALTLPLPKLSREKY